MDKSPQDIMLPDNRLIPAPEFLRLIIENLHDYSIFTMDKNGLINCWCAGSVKLFGYEPEETIGQPADIIFTAEDRANSIPLKERETALKEGRASDNRWHINNEGKLFYGHGLMFPLKDSNGELLGFVKILRDLTEKKMAEDAIQKHLKELDELNTHKENILAILSHDLRSPLSAIIEISQYLKTDIDHMKPEDIKQMVHILYEASTEELNMLDYLLEWARVKYVSDISTPVMLDLEQVVMKISETFSEFAATKSISLNNEVKERTEVFADKKMLTSILQNLVSNAIKFTPPGGNITVSATTEADKVTIKVKDTGIGMSAKQLEKLFKPQLKTLAQARKTEEGAGIGLLLVKGFVEKSGGKIWVESVEGKGSTFYFTLPNRRTSEKTNYTTHTVELAKGK